MTESLAQALERAQARFLARWPAALVASGEGAAPAPPAPFGHPEYERLLASARAPAVAQELPRWRQQGAAWATAGQDAGGLIAAALAFLDAVREALFDLDGAEPPAVEAQRRELEALQAEVLAALTSGFYSGQEKRADEQRLALEELAALYKINSAANSTLDFDQVLDLVAEHVTAAMHADVCSLFIYEPEIDRLVLRATRGLAPDARGRVRLRLGEGVTGWAGRAGKPLALNDGWTDDRFLHVPGLGEEQTRAILAVPIVFFTKLKLVGVITLQCYNDRQFTERDISFLETVAGEVAIAIENARLHHDTDERLRQKVAEMTILQGVSASIASTLNLQEVARLIASEAVHLTSVDASVVYALRDERLVPMASFGFATGEPAAPAPLGSPAPVEPAPPLPPPLDPSESVVGRALLAGKPIGVRTRDGGGDESHTLLHSLTRDASLPLPGVGMDAVAPLWVETGPDDLPFATRLCVPMLAPRSIVGGICLYCRGPRSFSEEQVSLLLAFAREGAIAIENAHLYEEARRGLEMQTLLLREMHHRVRNNLQRTSSLLRMQANRLPEDNPARHPLQESVIRIQSIARVHDLLSREKVGLTDVAAVANLACEVVNNTLGRPDLRVRWHVEAAPLLLSSREAFPLTLLLTEVLSNSVLHGFAGREEGQVWIKAWTAGEALMVEISDNGQGVADGFDSVRDAHLGLEVVARLGEQELGGEVRIASNPDGSGTRTRVCFPYQRPTGPAPTEVDRAAGAANIWAGA